MKRQFLAYLAVAVCGGYLGFIIGYESGLDTRPCYGCHKKDDGFIIQPRMRL